MKNIVKSCLVVLITILVSCKSTKPVVMQNEKIITTTITETVRDTIVKIEKDSSSYNALLECQAGKVVLKNVTQSESGSKLKIPKVRIDNNQLHVSCETEAQKLFIQWKETFIKEYKSKQIEVPIKVNELTWWQTTQLKAFKLHLIIDLLLIIIGLIIWFIKKK